MAAITQVITQTHAFEGHFATLNGSNKRSASNKTRYFTLYTRNKTGQVFAD